jgi:hypothetical protein
MKGSPVTAAVAILALVVGTGSAVDGYFVLRTANKHECVTADRTNDAVRGLVDDFLGPDVTKAQRTAADKLAAARFPDLHC